MDTTPKRIVSYMHCSQCLREVLKTAAKRTGASPAVHQFLEVGWTKQGIQVWCRKHDINLIHIDFQGIKHPLVKEEAAQ